MLLPGEWITQEFLFVNGERLRQVRDASVNLVFTYTPETGAGCLELFLVDEVLISCRKIADRTRYH